MSPPTCADSSPLAGVATGITVLPHRTPAAQLEIGPHPLVLLGLYVPSRGPRTRRNGAKRAVQNAIARALPALIARTPGPLVVAGDLNVVEPGHVPHHSVFGPWEYEFYEAFTNAGLVDAYRALHPDAVEHSWYGRSGKGYPSTTSS